MWIIILMMTINVLWSSYLLYCYILIQKQSNHLKKMYAEVQGLQHTYHQLIKTIKARGN